MVARLAGAGLALAPRSASGAAGFPVRHLATRVAPAAAAMPQRIRALIVAEKPAVAKGIAGILCPGARRVRCAPMLGMCARTRSSCLATTPPPLSINSK